MKSIRILLACSFALVTSAAFVRAEQPVENKAAGAVCPVTKNAEKKAEKTGCCGKDAVKSEKKEETKS